MTRLWRKRQRQVVIQLRKDNTVAWVMYPTDVEVRFTKTGEA